MPNPLHDRQQFYKYATAETCVAILDSGSVRYSSPLLFNDPFDVQARLRYDFDINQFPERCFAHISAMVMAPDTPTFVDPSEPFPQAINFMRGQRVSHGFPEAEIRAAVVPRLAELMKAAVGHLDELQRHWDNLLPRIRVFSVTEDPSNLLMWAHYAKCHSGVVLQLAVLPDDDNPLCVAKPIIYSRHTPSPFTERQFLDTVVGVRPMKLDELCIEYARVKGLDWRYEREWRVWDIEANPTAEIFSEYRLSTNELSAVYFGCKIDPTKRRAIEGMVRARYPNATLYQAKIATDSFALEFQEAT